MSRKLLLRIFFHLGFWPKAFLSWWKLLFRRQSLEVRSVELDRAFYLEGSWVILNWEVEHAWLIRVDHPGGFYHGSDTTWFTATPDMAPIRITIYGRGRRHRLRLPIRVKPQKASSQSESLLQVRTDTASIHRGPSYSELSLQLKSSELRVRPYMNEIHSILDRLRAAPDAASAREIFDEFMQHS